MIEKEEAVDPEDGLWASVQPASWKVPVPLWPAKLEITSAWWGRAAVHIQLHALAVRQRPVSKFMTHGLTVHLYWGSVADQRLFPKRRIDICRVWHRLTPKCYRWFTYQCSLMALNMTPSPKDTSRTTGWARSYGPRETVGCTLARTCCRDVSCSRNHTKLAPFWSYLINDYMQHTRTKHMMPPKSKERSPGTVSFFSVGNVRSSNVFLALEEPSH